MSGLEINYLNMLRIANKYLGRQVRYIFDDTINSLASN